MSGPNHIIGGTVFTGLYLSMWDINIYNHPLFLFFTAFFSVLPDIDHTKSFVGKLFYPVAKWLDKKFGHRTLTHSLLFYISLGILVGIIERTWLSTTTITKIYYWAFGSHLILDMLTLQGIPLFYPFKKNPCVLPANPNMRFRSSDFKAESIVFVIFLTTAFLSKDLFANGFWNTYNTNFGTIKHINNERLLYDKTISVEYDFNHDNSRFSGVGYLVASTADEAILFASSTGFVNIQASDKTYMLKPHRTNLLTKKNELFFTEISTDSLFQLCKSKAITVLKFNATVPLEFTSNHITQKANHADLTYIYNPVFRENKIDSVDANIEKEIQLIDLEIATNNQLYSKYLQEKEKLVSQLKAIDNLRFSANLEEKEKGILGYQKAKSDLESLAEPHNRITELTLKKRYLESKYHIKKSQKISGFISYLTFK